MTNKVPNPLVDLIGALITGPVTEAVLPTLQALEGKGITNIGYEYGIMDEIKKTLQEYDRAPSKNDKKYPLFTLITPFVEHMGDNSGYYSKAIVQMGILMFAPKDKKSKDYYADIIKPILLPCYEALIEAIEDSEYFVLYSRKDLKHNRMIRDDISKRPFLNIEGGTSDNVVAIELRDLELTVSYEGVLVDIGQVYGKQ
jgi:hypothetical protein